MSTVIVEAEVCLVGVKSTWFPKHAMSFPFQVFRLSMLICLMKGVKVLMTPYLGAKRIWSKLFMSAEYF